MDFGGIANYLYEAGQLKRVKRSGWWMVGVTQPESVAEHTFRTALLGYVLASLDGADAEKTAVICLFHDMAETRIGDLHRVTKRYIDSDAGEVQALEEQIAHLPQAIAQRVHSYHEEYEERGTREGLLARDADLLECLLQAREYQAQGFSGLEDWIQNCLKGLRSEIARKLGQSCLEIQPGEWWHGLKRTME